MDSYRSEKQATISIQLPDADAEIDPLPVAEGSAGLETELDRLSNILQGFNDQFGNISWTDSDSPRERLRHRVQRLITQDIPQKVAADPAFQNAMKNSDEQNARIEHEKVLRRVVIDAMKDDTELFRQFSDNDSFRKWLTNTTFTLNYNNAEIAQQEDLASWFVDFLAGSDTDPACRAVLPVLFLPDRSVVLKGVDGVLAGGEGFAAVGAADGDEDADFAYCKLASAVVDDDAGDVGPLLADLGGDLFEYGEGHGFVGLVFEGDDREAVGLVADHAAEEGDRTIPAIVC